MKKIPVLPILCAVFLSMPLGLSAHRLGDTLVVDGRQTPLQDSLRQAEKKEKKKDRKENRQAAGEQIKEGAKNAAEDIKDAAKEVYDDARQSVNEVKENLKESFKQAKESITVWFNENITANTVGDFAELQRQNNQNFADYLRGEWQVYPLEIREKDVMADGLFFTDKTKKIAAETKETLVVGVESVIEPMQKIRPPMPENYYEGAGKDAVSDLVSKQQFVTFKFYGQEIRIYYSPTLRNINIGKGLEKGVSKFWQYESNQDFNPVVFQLYQYKEDLALNDYQYYLLVRQFSDLVFNKAKKGENLLFTVFLLNQTGYDARIAQFQGDGSGRLAILLPFFEDVAAKAYVTVGKNSYYLMDVEPGKKLAQSSVKVYEKAHANASHPFSIRMEPQNARIAPLYGKFQGYTFDERLAEMLADLPSGPLAVYAEARFSRLMEKAFLYKLLPELDSVVNKRQDANLKEVLSERERQEMKILNLCAFLNRSLSSQSKQSAKIAAQYLYPEVMFFKKGSGDILDRSLLLCQISNRMLGIPAVLVVYPNFAMAAVCLPEGKCDVASPFNEGDYIEWNGKKYLLCGKLPKSVKEPDKARVYVW